MAVPAIPSCVASLPDGYLPRCVRRALKQSSPEIHVRAGVAADLDALIALETKVFAADRMSRRSLRHFLAAKTAAVIVAEYDGRMAGSAVVLFRPNSAIARLYSIAVAPHRSGFGIGPLLLSAAEETALGRDCLYLRLEVHENNHRAITRYRKAGYREFGRHEKYRGQGPRASFREMRHHVSPGSRRRRLTFTRRPSSHAGPLA